MSSIPNLSIIIVNWNVKELLRNCLKSIYAQTKAISFEVFVVDNASSDGSVEMVEEEFPQVKLIKNEENLGFAKANNQGIRQSTGKYILLLNPDTIVVDDALVNMVLFMDARRDIGAVGPRILNPDNTVQLTCGRYFPTPLTELWDLTRLSYLFPKSRIFGRSLMGFWPHHDTREVDLLSGACMMVRREAIEQTGLMDEDFFLFAEEADWCYRIKKNGWKIYLNADAEVIHFLGQSVKLSSANTALESRKSTYLFFMKYYGRLSALIYRAMVLVFVALRIPVYWVWQCLRPADRPRVRAALRCYPEILRWAIRPPK
jgi:GT2 family glycosyltransferase